MKNYVCMHVCVYIDEEIHVILIRPLSFIQKWRLSCPELTISGRKSLVDHVILGGSLEDVNCSETMQNRYDKRNYYNQEVNYNYCHVEGCLIGRVLDWMIGFIATYTFITLDYRQLQRYRWYTHFTVHRYARTRVLGLHLSDPGNGFITVSL
jgi:hypothetical protein